MLRILFSWSRRNLAKPFLDDACGANYAQSGWGGEAALHSNLKASLHPEPKPFPSLCVYPTYAHTECRRQGTTVTGFSGAPTKSEWQSPSKEKPGIDKSSAGLPKKQHFPAAFGSAGCAPVSLQYWVCNAMCNSIQLSMLSFRKHFQSHFTGEKAQMTWPHQFWSIWCSYSSMASEYS